MIVMPADNTGIKVGYVAARYEHAPARLGHLYSPGKPKKRGGYSDPPGPFHFMPYALDNGAFPAWTHQRPWDVHGWRALVEWARNAGLQPIWALVPDVVTDREATLRAWDRYAPELAPCGWPLAFAAQDGMTFADVPSDAAVVFMGGSYEWKWRNVAAWGAAFPGRLHVGRVNGIRQLRICQDVGAASCDGTGLPRTNRQWRQLERILAEMAGECSRDDQSSALFDDSDGETDHGLRCCTTAEPATIGEGN